MSDVIDPEIANPKVIFHIDGDAFFVGVEVAKNPKLKGLPVVTGEEREWRNEILWFWNHHAISCAVWAYKDKEAAKRYVAKALEYQTLDHPNQITQLLDFLINDKIEEAERWAGKITKEPEKSTAVSLVEDYKEGRFF